ncbi:MAG: class II aldolase/adducin family protein [Synergistaceae bacterium]|nr:class II aldolase/adducin family protein [Synergistaceae bacterium]
MLQYYDERAAVADYMCRLYERGYTTSLGGNISFRIGEHVLITPAKVDKGRLTPELVGIITIHGDTLTPHIELSIETEMHLRILQSRTDISAIIHAHPTFSTFFTALNVGINTKLTAEAYSVLGTPVKATYALMGTKQLAYSVGEAALKSNIVLMENHGVLTVGKSLLEAFNRIEVLESTAKMNLIMMCIKDSNYITPLSSQSLEEIKRIF